MDVAHRRLPYNFVPKSVLQLTDLRSVVVVAQSANKEENEPHHQSRRSEYPYSSVDEEKFDHLQAAVGLAHQLKDGFEADGRKVAVQVCLRHIRNARSRSFSKCADESVEYEVAIVLGRSCSLDMNECGQRAWTKKALRVRGNLQNNIRWEESRIQISNEIRDKHRS